MTSMRTSRLFQLLEIEAYVEGCGRLVSSRESRQFDLVCAAGAKDKDLSTETKNGHQPPILFGNIRDMACILTLRAVSFSEERGCALILTQVDYVDGWPGECIYLTVQELAVCTFSQTGIWRRSWRQRLFH